MEAQPSRDRILTHEEVKRVWIAAETMGYPFGTIVKLLLLTGCRKSEIGSLQWNQIQEKQMTIPASVSKNGREHTIPIPSLAYDLLKQRQTSTTNSVNVFLATSGKSERYNGYAFHLKELQKKSGTSNWTLHDLRRTFASLHAELGTPIHIIEKMLNHVSGQISGVAAIYNRYSYQSEMREAVDKYEQFIQKLVE
jgi:integrase